mgnify:FL=1
MKGRIAWTEGDNLLVVRKGRTTNKKIAPEKASVVQTYTFDLRQAAMVRSAHTDTKKVDRGNFFRMDGANCLDCPLASLKGCYTHKYMQYSGFISMLRSLSTEDIYSRERTDLAPIKDWCAESQLTRFGSYGEPSLLPIDLVSDMADASATHTGYTHQAGKDWADDYKDFVMASSHDQEGADKLPSWRHFNTLRKGNEAVGVQGPASKEMGYVSNCAKCGLCSGVKGKGRKNVTINIH